jgi:hypothetical protein
MNWQFKWCRYSGPDDKIPEYHIFIYYKKSQIGNVTLTETQFKEWQELWGPERFTAHPNLFTTEFNMNLIERFYNEEDFNNPRLLGIPLDRIRMIRSFSTPIGSKIVIQTHLKHDSPELISYSSKSFTFGYDDKWFSYTLPEGIGEDKAIVFQNQNKDELTLLVVKLEFLH